MAFIVTQVGVGIGAFIEGFINIELKILRADAIDLLIKVLTNSSGSSLHNRLIKKLVDS